MAIPDYEVDESTMVASQDSDEEKATLEVCCCAVQSVQLRLGSLAVFT